MNQASIEKPTGRRVFTLGFVLAALMAAWLALAAGPAHATTTFTVNTTGDKHDLDFPGGTFDGSSDGTCLTNSIYLGVKECTLRAAIQEANVTPGADTIDFAIPGTGVATISPTSQLPTITEAVTIDGYSQPGAEPNTLAVGNDAVLKVELRGPGSGSGLRIGAANSTVKGLVINHFSYGTLISGSGATGNKVAGNYLGTDASATQDLGNSFGVVIADAPNNTVGGATVGERNLISGNDQYGVQIFNAAAKGNKVAGNYVGTDSNGTAPLGNSYGGVFVQDYATGNTIGGTEAGARNTISANNYDGVQILGNSATDNRVLSNSIFSNGELGIDLVGTDGPDANDSKDPDTGANGLQNKPVLTSAKTSATSTTVQGTLNSTPNKTILVHLFSSPLGTGDEDLTLRGQKSVTTDSSGNASFTFSSTDKVEVGRRMTATATDPAGNTSEFSAPKAVVAQ